MTADNDNDAIGTRDPDAISVTTYNLQPSRTRPISSLSPQGQQHQPGASVRQTLNLDQMNDLTNPLAEFSDDKSGDLADQHPLTTHAPDPAPATATAGTSIADDPPLALQQEV
jgi:hypothetical protein